MENKKNYEVPRLDTVTFSEGDIITSSLGDNGFDGVTDTDW